MTKSILAALAATFLFISCGDLPADQAGGELAKRDRNIENIEDDGKGFLGVVSDFNGTFEGRCGGVFNGVNISGCEPSVEITQDALGFSVNIKILANGVSAEFSYKDYRINGNVVSNSSSLVVGNIGKAGFKVSDGGHIIRFLRDERGVVYFDLSIKNDALEKTVIYADLKDVAKRK